MSPAPILNNNDQQHPQTNNLSIEIEPSYPLIMAITEFFRAQKKPEKSLELCQMGLGYFPGDLGLRLGMALSYLDLSERDKAGIEIKTVVQELNQLTSILEAIAKHFRNNKQNNLSEWFHQLSLILSKFPGDHLEETTESQTPSLFPEEKLQPEISSRIHENSPQGNLNPSTFSQIANEEISLLSPGKTTNEKARPSEVLPDSSILSTLTGWLSQLKESHT
jgi:hypothetical protein